MSRDSWFRNTDWNDVIAAAFDEKLKRARDKSQYLRIQAGTLAQTHPQVALSLLDRYFALGENFDMAQAHVDRATAYLALGDLESAFMSYEAALARERAHPNMRTNAYLDLPYLIATNEASDRFEQAMLMLSSSVGQLMFPIDRFKHHASRAIILAKTERGARHAGSQAGARGCGIRSFWFSLSSESWACI